MRARRLPAVSLLCALGWGFALGAQTPNGSAPPPPPGYILHTGTRIVLTDVTVLDKNGNPVKGLTGGDFRVSDNGKEQKLASFEEHTGALGELVPTAAAESSLHSNSYLLHAPPASNVLLLDITNLGIVDQMYLSQQMQKFVEALPAGEPLAIYMRAGDFTLPLVNFTTDRNLLLAAVRKAVPRLPQPDAQYTTDLDTLLQMIAFLRQLPGRKNLLWFSGGSNLFLVPDASTLAPQVDMRPIYDALEASRIAVYPVDARGLTVSTPGGLIEQHFLMEDVAQATGGEAFFNTNGLAQAAARATATSGDFYTLTYSPRDAHFDGKWHKVKVEVKGGSYQLSYRRGYFDDGANVTPAGSKPSTLLRADGETVKLPGPASDPIIFQARILPAATAPPADPHEAPGQAPPTPAPKRNEVTYAIHYTLPAGDFVQHPSDGGQQVVVGTGVIAINRYGRPVSRLTRAVTLEIDEAKFQTHPNGTLDFDQQINLPDGDEYLYIAVWDTATRRFGTLQVALNVQKLSAPPRPPAP